MTRRCAELLLPRWGRVSLLLRRGRSDYPLFTNSLPLLPWLHCAAPNGVATVSTPSPPTMGAPSVPPVVAGVSVFVDPQTPAASTMIPGPVPAVLPTAAVKVSVGSSAPSTTALADVLPGWLADAAARGVTLTSVYVVHSLVARRGGEDLESIQTAATTDTRRTATAESTPARRRRYRCCRRDEPVPASGKCLSRQS